MRPLSAWRRRSSRQATRAKRSRRIASFSSHSARLPPSSLPTLRRAASLPVADAEPLTEADYDAIVDRLAGIAAFRRAVDMQAEWLKNFPASSRREEIESARVQHLYSLRANDDARLRANTFLKEHPDSDQAQATSSSRSSGSMCVKGALPTSRSVDARS